MSLKLKNQTATLKNFNVRKERHGEEKVLAVDLKIEMQTGIETLKRFDPSLESFMFSGNVVRFPSMGAVTFDDEMTEVALDVSGTKISSATLKKFSLLPDLDAAGTKIVHMTFNASFAPDKAAFSKLPDLVQESITIDIDTQELV